MKARQVWATFCVLTLAAIASGQQNILINSGFETGEAWGWAARAGDAHSGQFSAYLCEGLMITQEFAPVPLDQVTETCFWIQFDPPGEGIAGYYVRWVHDRQGRPVSNATPIYAAPVSEWLFIDCTMPANADWLLSGIEIGHISYAESCFRVDDVQITVIPEPGTLSLLVVGAVVAARGRRRWPARWVSPARPAGACAPRRGLS